MADVVVERVGDRIHLYSPYFPGVSDMCKGVPGHRWNAEKKYWTYPLSLQTCRNLRRVFHSMLVIGPDLTAWAWEQRRTEEALAHLGRQDDAELLLVPTIAPRMATAMASRPYQRVGARFIATARRTLLADEPTLGKTIQVYGGLIEAGAWHGAHLIAAPKSSLETVWADELHKWTDDAEAFHMPEGKAKRDKEIARFFESAAPSKFLIINPEMLQTKIKHWCKQCDRFAPAGDTWPVDHYTEGHKTKPEIESQRFPELFEVQWNSITVDESHKYLLGIKGVNRKTQAGEGFTRLRTVPSPVLTAVTGTPLKGKAKNFWPTFHWLRPEQYSSLWQFAESYLEVTDNGFGKVIGDINPYREQELYKSLDGIMLRRTKREVQPDLPEDMYQNVWVEMSPKQLKQYASMSEEAEATFGDTRIAATGVLAEFTRLKQLAFGEWTAKESGGRKLTPVTSPKLDRLIDMLAKRGVTGKPDEDFRLEGGYKYIIASQFTEVIDFVVDALRERGIECLVITGAVTGKKRTEAVRSFQSDSAEQPRVLAVNTQAGGASLTLDAWCDEMFILDETWVRDDQIQLEGRIRNRDVEKRVATRTYHYIRTRGTIEEEIADSGLSQDEFQKQLLDRRRGVRLASRNLEGASSDDA